MNGNQNDFYVAPPFLASVQNAHSRRLSTKEAAQHHSNRRKVSFESDKYDQSFEFKNSLRPSDLMLENHYQGYLNLLKHYKPPLATKKSGESFRHPSHYYENSTDMTEYAKTINMRMHGKPSHKIQTDPVKINRKTKSKACNHIDDDEELLVIVTGVNMLPINNSNPKLLKKSLEKLFDFIDNYIQN